MIRKHSYARRKIAFAALLLFSSIVGSGCDDDSSGPEDEIEWQAALDGVGTHDDVSAEALVVSRASSFDAEIDIEDATAAAVFTWRVASGTCAQPGARIGTAAQYPNLTIAQNGTASAEAEITGILDGDEDYIVQVLDERGAQPVVVACGVLERD